MFGFPRFEDFVVAAFCFDHFASVWVFVALDHAGFSTRRLLSCSRFAAGSRVENCNYVAQGEIVGRKESA